MADRVQTEPNHARKVYLPNFPELYPTKGNFIWIYFVPLWLMSFSTWRGSVENVSNYNLCILNLSPRRKKRRLYNREMLDHLEGGGSNFFLIEKDKKQCIRKFQTTFYQVLHKIVIRNNVRTDLKCLLVSRRT